MINKRKLIHGDLHLILLVLILIILLARGLSEATAESALQPGQPTDTPEPTVFPTLVPLPTAEIDPEALILEDGWRDPFNLSRSGATSTSQMVIDSNGVYHILWRDQVEGFGYVSGSGEQWSSPVVAEYPFFTRQYFPDLSDSAATPIFTPKLVADQQGQILAFWISDDGVLYYSRVPANSFTNFEAWQTRSALSADTLAISALTGNDGTVHTAYLRRQDSEDRPAGIYYRQLDNSGTWQNSILLYPSRYLRSIGASQANIQLLTTNDNNVYVVWDDPLKQQVFFARSRNNGQNWEPVQMIDRRTAEDAEAAVGPSGITIGGNSDSLQLTWRAGHEADQACSQYFATSTDGGETWGDSLALTSLPNCLNRSQFFTVDGLQFLMGTAAQGEAEDGSIISTTYFLAWDGNRWSDPQEQEPLSRFANPETYLTVRLGCHLAVGQENRIELLGCDTAEGGDIWFMLRETGEIGEWFPPPPVWQGPDRLNYEDDSPAEVQLVSSGDGTVHAFWSLENSPLIQYSGWNGETWSPSQEIIRSSGSRSLSLSGASSNDRLYLIWKDANRGIQFSEASMSNPNQWSEPITLAEGRVEASSPSIVADDGGNIYVVFAEQFNETRGVYLIHSADAGATWSDPMQVFDGAAAGWDVVEKPVLTRSENGQMHLIWTRRSLPPESIPLELAYSRSEDLGRSWSEAEAVVEAETYWNQLVGIGERIVHLLWNEGSGNQEVIWHRFSQDGGLTWSQAEQVTGITSGGQAVAIADPVGRLHLLTIDIGELSDLIWVDDNWIVDEGLEVDLGDGLDLAASANVRGEMVVSYIEAPIAGQDSTGDNDLYALWRTLDLPEELPTPLPTLTPTQPPLSATATSTPQPTPTVFFSTEREQTGIGEIPGLGGLPISSDLLIALLPVLLIVIIGLIIGLRIIRKR